MKKEKRIEEILKTGRRMSVNCWDLNWKNVNKKINRFGGVYKIIRKYFNKDFIVAEIGCYEGNLSEFFALQCKELYCIDPWDSSIYSNNTYKNDYNTFKNCLEEKKKAFYKIKNKYKNINTIENFSYNVYNWFPDKFFDCIYLDGNHSYEAVKQDIIQWKPKVKTKGILSGHDYTSQVKKAVQETLGTVERYEDTSWVKVIT